MKAPTKKQVAAEIATLEKLKPRVRPSSMFGDDHHAAIDAQLVVLRERLDSDEIHKRFAPITAEELAAESGEEPDESQAADINRDEGRADNVVTEALDAALWLDGDIKEKPSASWKELVS